MPTIPEAIFLDDPVPSVFALGYGPWLHIQIRSEFLGFVTRLRGRWTLGWGIVLLIRNPRSVGLIVGAWGFTLCLHCSTWAWRFEDYLMGPSMKCN